MSKTFFQRVTDEANAGSRTQADVDAAITNDHGWIVQGFIDCEAKYPKPAKGEADAFKDKRNNAMSIMRMRLSRAAKKAGYAKATVKRVEGEYQLIITEASPEPGDGEGEADEGQGSNAPGSNEEKQQEALMDAVELVAQNIDNPIVLNRIREALGQLKAAA